MALTNSRNAAIETQTDALIFNLTIAMVAVAGVAIAIGVVIGLLIAASIRKPVEELKSVAERIAVGDVNQAIRLHSKDELGQLAESFRGMIVYLKEMAGAADQLATGDLTVEVTPRSEGDQLGKSLHAMVDSLRELATALLGNAEQVAGAAEQMAQASAQAGQATEQIAMTMQQVASGSTQQAASITATASSVEEMRRAIDSVANGSQEQATAIGTTSEAMSRLSGAVGDIRRATGEQAAGMQRAAEMRAGLADTLHQVAQATDAVVQEALSSAKAADEGIKFAVQTMDGMQRVNDTTEQLASRVRDLGRRSDQIGAIVETIDDIASQTNLLALNAAIEAARAGEHGKGFAVVADEVRKLAERSSVATKEIGGLIKGIQKTVSEAVVAMSESAGEVEAGVTQANNAGHALESIVKAADAVYQQADQATKAAEKMNAAANELVTAVDSVSAVIEENTAATEEMSAGAHEVTQSIENIASVSEENSASVEEVSASAEEMSAQVEEVSASAQHLAGMAIELKALVGQFKLGEDPMPTIGPARSLRCRPQAGTCPGEPVWRRTWLDDGDDLSQALSDAGCGHAGLRVGRVRASGASTRDRPARGRDPDRDARDDAPAGDPHLSARGSDGSRPRLCHLGPDLRILPGASAQRRLGGDHPTRFYLRTPISSRSSRLMVKCCSARPMTTTPASRSVPRRVDRAPAIGRLAHGGRDLHGQPMCIRFRSTERRHPRVALSVLPFGPDWADRGVHRVRRLRR